MATTALLEIDFQNWIVALAHDPGVLARARQARDQLRAAGADIYCLRYLDPAPGPRHDPQAAANSFAAPLTPEPGDTVLSKSASDAFANPDLHTNLQLNGTTHLVLSGLVTDHGVTNTARSALQHGYHVTVLQRATAATDAEAHTAALKHLRMAGARLR